MRKFLGTIVIVIFLIFVGLILFSAAGIVSIISPTEPKLSKAAILHLELEGIILDGKQVLEFIHRYADEDLIKGILIHINSPGGVVGPSQEIYAELKRVRDELKKPVVASLSGVAASGAYYAALGANKIVTNPGTMVGSIGVIMEFANLSGLYSWAKIDRYSIKSGAYKDAGADYRSMTSDERQLFQGLIDEVLAQFKQTILDSRKMEVRILDQYADGRVFTGETAVRLGFADQVGTFEDARHLIGEMAGLGSDPELMKPREKREEFWQLVEDFSGESKFKQIFEELLQAKLLAKPLLIVPGTLGFGK